MHVAILKANTVPGSAIIAEEKPEELAALLNAILASQGATTGLADASIAAAAGSRLWAASLTLAINNGAGTAAVPSAPGLTAFVFTLETPAEIEAKRVFAFVQPTFPAQVYLDKTAGG